MSQSTKVKGQGFQAMMIACRLLIALSLLCVEAKGIYEPFICNM